MLHDTHVRIGLNTWKILSEKEREIMKKKSFINGNILPDIHPVYRVRKHRLKQFEVKVFKKIEYLSKLTYSEIKNEVGDNVFSRELGIICHLISDFFCMPHSQWGVKESMTLKHVKYERNLHKEVVVFEQITDLYEITDLNDYKKFLEVSLKKHKNKNSKKHHYENDLYYSMFMCNSITKYILLSVENNSKN